MARAETPEERRHALIARAIRHVFTTDELVDWNSGERATIVDAVVYLAEVTKHGLADIAKAIRQTAPAQWASEAESRDHRSGF